MVPGDGPNVCRNIAANAQFVGEPSRSDRSISALAVRQHGLVARRQLAGLGFERSAIDFRIRRGLLLPVHRGVYAVGHDRLTKEGRWMAAALAGGPDAVVSHRAAGQLWGLIPRSAAVAEVTRPRPFKKRDRVNFHHGRVPPDELEVVDGIPATSASRTLLDLAGMVARREWTTDQGLERALNEMEARRLTCALSIPDLLRRYPRRPGAGMLRELLDQDAGSRGVTREELEARFAVFVDTHGLPRPLRNADVAARGRFYEGDCVWPDRRLIVELDGRATHDTRLAYESDRRRDRHLVTDGWRVIRLTWRQLRDEGPAIAEELRVALGSPRHLPLVR